MVPGKRLLERSGDPDGTEASNRGREWRDRTDGVPAASGPVTAGDPGAGRGRDGRRRPDLARAGARRAQPRPGGRDRRPARRWPTGPPTWTPRSPATTWTSTSTRSSPTRGRRRSGPPSTPASTSTPRSRSRTARRRARPGPGGPRGRHQARRRAGQALPARPAQAQAARRRRLLRPDPLRAGRVRLLGLRGRLAEPRSVRRGTTGPPTAAASCWTCSRTGTTCWSSCSARSARSPR